MGLKTIQNVRSGELKTQNYASKVRLTTVYKVGLNTIQRKTLYYLQVLLLVTSDQGLAYRSCEALAPLQVNST